MPLPAVEAASHVNESVTVEMLVKAAKNCRHCSQVFLDSEADHHDPKNLDSEADHHDPKNLAVAITESGKAKFKEAKIDDPTNHFQGRVIRVSGVVRLQDNRPRIDVDDPDQIEVKTEVSGRHE
jgi:hypothetical protein